jgi:autotransporter-associated beta strand protein
MNVSLYNSLIAKRKAAFPIIALALAVSLPCVRAASDTWTGTSSATWATPGNWLGSSVPGTGNTGTFNGAGNGNTTLDLGAGVTLGTLLFNTSSAAAYTIGAGAVGSQTLTLDNAGAITVNAGVTASQLVNANIQLSNAASATATFTNNGSGSLTIAGTLNANVASGNGRLTIAGSGDTTINGAVTKTGAGSNALFKQGAGTLTLTNGSTWSGTGATSGGFSGPLIAQQGTLRLNGGTHTVTGEAVIGGVVTNGGAGQNAKIQVDAGALNVSTYLSVGRGNGTGAVSSDLVINNSGAVTTQYLSAGFNGGSGLNLPKGSITLNNTSTLTVTSTDTGTAANIATFNIGESTGSNFTLTVNDSSTVNRTGGNTGLAGGSQNQGAVQIGRDGTGAVIMNGGTFNVASTDLGRGVNNASTQNGTLTIKTGATYNNEGDFRMGFAGSSSAQATLNLQGGTLNIGTTTTRTMVIGTFDAAKSTVNMTSGNLNLNANSSIRFNASNNSGAKVFNMDGGAITSYSDNATTVNGSGVLDLMQGGVASSNNTFNLNGGTLAVTQVMSSTGNGTRTFNFNGGTLKATGSSSAFITLNTGGTARVNVRNGGAIIDTNGYAVTVSQALEHSNIGGDNAIDGGLIKNGEGSLTLSGTNTFTGNMVVNAGMLSLASNVSLNDTIVLRLAENTWLDLGFGDGSETIYALVLNGVNVAPGTYRDDQLAALDSSIMFSSSGGTLTVLSTVPEPGVVALLVMGLVGLMLFRHRPRQA